MYTPSDEILQKYSHVLVNFALWSWIWVKNGQVVYIQIPQSAEAFLPFLYEAVLWAWCHPIVDLVPTYLQKVFYDKASDEQLNRIPTETLLWRLQDIDHKICIISHEDKYLLEEISPDKILIRETAFKHIKKSLIEKEVNGEFTWTMWLYGTESMAQEAGITIETYREQIIEACFLNDENPINKRKETYESLDMIMNHLNSLSVDYLQVIGQDVDLKIWIGKHRKRLTWSGRNMPSFEVFISPDCRITEGWIRCNQPLYIQWKMLTGIELKFLNGLLVDSRATQHEDVLSEIVAIWWMNKIWEFSLTDARLSKITKFMWETLYDENMWGEYGNTHIALWDSFKQSYPWDPNSVNQNQWDDRWYNESSLHIDLVSTSDRTVVATMTDWSQQIVYQHGRFTFFDIPEIDDIDSDLE